MVRPSIPAVSLAWVMLAALAVSACRGGYILQQGVGQLALLSRREPIARVLQERDLPPRTRDRLVLVWYARRFAERVLGLSASESYRDVVRLDRDAASYVVAAAPPDSLEPYRWCFPIAGCLPYIGYFSRADAEREKQRLAALGYDVWMRGVAGYSLGGWLPDPVYSPLLEDSRGWVANTVIHELTHGTVFLSGRAAFNEGFATFVGDHGAIMLLEQRYGAASRTVREALAEQRDQRRYGAFIDDLVRGLRAVYTAPISREEKLRRRAEVFARSRAHAREVPFETMGYARMAQREVNNAFLATHGTYFGYEPRFEAIYQRLGRDLPRFIAFVRDHVARARDPDAFITTWLAQP